MRESGRSLTAAGEGPAKVEEAEPTWEAPEDRGRLLDAC